MDPELQRRLDELQQELEEGEITVKGYEKRRGQLLAQYPSPLDETPPPLPHGGLQIHAPWDNDDGAIYPPAQDEGHRAAAARALMSAGSNNNSSNNGTTSVSPLSVGGFRPPSVHSQQQQQQQLDGGGGGGHPAGLLRPGGPMADSRPAPNKHDSLLFLSPSQKRDSRDSVYLSGPESSDGRTLTMASVDYAFRPPQQQQQHQHQQQQPQHQHDQPGGYGGYGGASYDDRYGFEDKQQQQQYGRASTLLQDAQGFFSDFAGQQQGYDDQAASEYGGGSGPGRYSMAQSQHQPEPLSPTAAMAPPPLSSSDLPGPDLRYQSPLEPREVPFSITDPLDANQAMSQFENLAAVIRYRGGRAGKQPAYWVLDAKGKEVASITWDKLASKAEKVGQVIRDKSNLYRGDRVALVYRDSEIIDFAIALLGCFIAGVVAVPVSEPADFARLGQILTSTQAHLALTTDSTLKTFQRDKLAWPRGVEWWKTNEFGSHSPRRKDDHLAPLATPDLAYIEFSRAPTGDLRGVVLSHRTVMHQMACLTAVVSTVPGTGPGDTFSRTLQDRDGRVIRQGSGAETLLSYLDPRLGIGMILTVLLSVYGGHTTVWVDSRAVELPGLYAHLITKYRASVLVADYPGLKRAAYNYQQDPMATRSFKKGTEPNFGAVKLCLIDTLTVDSEFHEVLADRWLRPLRNLRAREAVAPMLCLPEHGGMVISMRDWLGGEERMGIPLGAAAAAGTLAGMDEDKPGGELTAAAAPTIITGEKGGHEGGEVERSEAGIGTTVASEVGGGGEGGAGAGDGFVSLLGGGGGSGPAADQVGSGGSGGSGGGGVGGSRAGGTDLGEVLLDREALKTNEVVVVAAGEEARRRAAAAATAVGDPGWVRVGAFGYPIPDATVAVVEPDTGMLAAPDTVGEIWVDSPSLSGGFWALPKHTAQIFHARPYRFDPGEPTPTLIEPEFLRTGLLGAVIEGKVYVLGLYEDRIRQRVEEADMELEGVGHHNDDGHHAHHHAHHQLLDQHRYFFVQHVVVSIVKNVPKIYDCSAFDVVVNAEHLPVIVLETVAASTAPTASGGPPRPLDTALLDSLAERCVEVLAHEHQLRPYCVLITAPSQLPRVLKNGRREIGNMLCRREFEQGSLPCVHVRFGVERAVPSLPVGVDPIGGIWSARAAGARAALLRSRGADRQYSGVDRREVVIDDRTSTPLTSFRSITDLVQWRVARQPDDLAYCTVDARGREGKGMSWRKFDTRIAAVAVYLKTRAKIQAGDHAILMYTHSEEYVIAVHACAALGIISIPTAPLDQNRLSEDVPAYLHVVADYRVKAVLVNQEVDALLRNKAVASHIRQSAQILSITVPGIHNTTKPPRQGGGGCRDLGLTVDPAWVQPGYPVMVWTYWTPDQRRIAVQLGHDTILGMCKVQKETCQMTSSRPVLGCVRSYTGLGFLHTAALGIYVGSPTYLLSPLEFAANPSALFVILARYKIKDGYATGQMLDYAMAAMQHKNFSLHELKNMMISAEARPRIDVFQKVRLYFAANGLDRTAINTVYSHVLNPMIASRSYMCIEPIELWLDARALRRGLIVTVDPIDEIDGTSLQQKQQQQQQQQQQQLLLVQDSGMVPVSTHIAIVNPETRSHCRDGEFGEIWVDSEACVKGFYGSKDLFDAERFDGRTVDGDPAVRFVRTGDLGFLHSVSRPIGPGGAQVDMQVLFVIGSIGETFEINGLNHFPMDIEASVERCHRNIVPSGCAVFQAGGLMVVLVEVTRKSHLASLVPVIVNAILNEHQVIVDIVAFVARGDFPRSRLGEKQRGKILATWINRKMRTMAQFAIRDTDPMAAGGAGAGGGSEPHRQSSTGSARSGTVTSPPHHRVSTASFTSLVGGAPLQASSSSSLLRNMEQAPQILEQEEVEQQMMRLAAIPPRATAIAEMPADYGVELAAAGRAPTFTSGSERPPHPPAVAPRPSGVSPIYYSPVEPPASFAFFSSDPAGSGGGEERPRKLAIVNHDDDDTTPMGPPPPPLPPPRVQSRIQPRVQSMTDQSLRSGSLRLPAIDGRELLEGDGTGGYEEDDWTADAIMHMNLSGR